MEIFLEIVRAIYVTPSRQTDKCTSKNKLKIEKNL